MTYEKPMLPPGTLDSKIELEDDKTYQAESI